MSVNQLLRQGVGLMEGLTALPFSVVRQLWDEESSGTSQVIKQAATLSEGLVTMPFRLAREMLGDDTSGQITSGYAVKLKNQNNRQGPGGSNPQ